MHIHDTERDVIGILENTLRKIPDLPPSEASTPERLIAGIGAGLTLGMMGEIVLVEVEGSACMPVFFRGAALR